MINNYIHLLKITLIFNIITTINVIVIINSGNFYWEIFSVKFMGNFQE